MFLKPLYFNIRKAFATATSTPKNALMIIGTRNSNTIVVEKYNVKNNSSKTIAEFPGMTIKSTFEHQGMRMYLSTKAGASFIFHKL